MFLLIGSTVNRNQNPIHDTDKEKRSIKGVSYNNNNSNNN